MASECAYERLNDDALLQAIAVRPGERLLVLQPFGWHIDGQKIPNMPEQFDREGVCQELGVEVVVDFGDYIAVVRDRIPRRNRMDRWVPAERAIHDALQVVERTGAHPHLTAAVTLLGQAQQKVADYVDGVTTR